jgi:hypothetical protein
MLYSEALNQYNYEKCHQIASSLENHLICKQKIQMDV